VTHSTDQKVGGSSPSERANVFPAQRVEPSGSISPPVPSSRILAASAIPAASFRRFGVAVHLAGIQVPVQVPRRGDAGMTHGCATPP